MTRVQTCALPISLCAIGWLANTAEPPAQIVFQAVSAGERLEDFAKGVIDNAPAMTCIAITAAALFLTTRGLAAGRAAR